MMVINLRQDNKLAFQKLRNLNDTVKYKEDCDKERGIKKIISNSEINLNLALLKLRLMKQQISHADY